MSNIPLFNFFILAIIFAVSGLISLIFSFYCSSKVGKYTMDELETDTMDIIIMKKPTKLKQWNNALFAFKIITLLALAAAICFLSVFMYYENLAKKYGAYDDFAKKQSINLIKQNIENGYIDQSNELPDDLTGCIIVYFKYGCSDCEKIHDDLLNYIDEKNVTDIYFVSTRSDKGKELLNQYSVEIVPSGIYIMKEPIGLTKRYTEILYDMNASKSQKHTFMEQNFDKLLKYQANERTDKE